MAKKKKTRQDKIKADLRHELPRTPLYVVSQPTEKVAKIPTIISTKQELSGTYFVDDLRKTFYLIIAILTGQLTLFYMLKNHLINLPFISY